VSAEAVEFAGGKPDLLPFRPPIHSAATISPITGCDVLRPTRRISARLFARHCLFILRLVALGRTAKRPQMRGSRSLGHRAKPIGNQPGGDAVDGVGGLNGSLRWEEI
jgi:hypothetical protein